MSLEIAEEEQQPIELDMPIKDERLLEIDGLLTLAKFTTEEMDRYAAVRMEDKLNELTDYAREAGTECRHLRQALVDKDTQFKSELLSHGLLTKDIATLAEQLTATTKRINELEGYALGHRNQIKSLQSQLANKQVPSPELESIADYLAGIRPDSNCRTPGCWGSRGYSSFTVDVDTETGHRKITVNLCCGKVGETDYARILRKLNEMSLHNQNAFNVTLNFLARHLLMAMIHNQWVILKGKLKRKPKTLSTPTQFKPETMH